jgi:predicted RNA binding protein YcfA (HicA-like mRNA interferase family)
MKVRELIRLLEANGWSWVRTTGSHRHFKHPANPNIVTVPGKFSSDLKPGTESSILKAAGLKRS